MAAAKENFAEAGLDGWAHLALPVITVMKPQLRKGAMVVCDNAGQFPAAFEPFTVYMRNPENGFASTLLPLRGGTEMAVRL